MKNSEPHVDLEDRNLIKYIKDFVRSMNDIGNTAIQKVLMPFIIPDPNKSLYDANGKVLYNDQKSYLTLADWSWICFLITLYRL